MAPTYTSLLHLHDRMQENIREIGLVIRLGLLVLTIVSGLALVTTSVPYYLKLKEVEWDLHNGSRCYHANIVKAEFKNVCVYYKVWTAFAFVGGAFGLAHVLTSLIVFAINYVHATRPPRVDYGVKYYLYKDSFIIFIGYRVLLLFLFIYLLINLQSSRADSGIPDEYETLQSRAHVFTVVSGVDIGLASLILLICILSKLFKYFCIEDYSD